MRGQYKPGKAPFLVKELDKILNEGDGFRMKNAELVRARLEESRLQREKRTVHPKSCKCGGHGNIPQGQFSCGYTKCE